MTDLELLELAAKAAGITWPQNISAFQMQYEGEKSWNPLADDGDALRLAVKLFISVVYEVRYGFSSVAAVAPSYLKGMSISPVVRNWANPGQTPDEATRRAIVELAAQLGKEMP